MKTFTSNRNSSRIESFIGLAIATTILTFWSSSLIFLLSIPIGSLSIIGIIIGILVRTILQTGLFVIGHDAMHLNLYPKNRTINNWMGRLSIQLYAFLPYQQCCIKHRKHHRRPAQPGDPDFHDGVNTHPICWYVKFMGEYLPGDRILAFLVIWGLIYAILTQCFKVDWVNFMLFVLLPLWLSSLQLFFFGTYLPHRTLTDLEQSKEVRLMPAVRPSNHRRFLSFLTCYHFGFYHEEHHSSPKTPWYLLPSLSKINDGRISLDNRIMRENLL